MVPRERALAILREEMDRHGLHDWKAEVRMAYQPGLCWYGSKKIVLSTGMTRANGEDVVREVARHEVAHALLPRGEGHGEAWKAMCLVVGCPPRECADGVRFSTLPWYCYCPDCNFNYPAKQKLGRASSCPVCDTPLLWAEG